MKKAFSVFLSFCLCTITMLGFTACGDDEHEDKHEHGRRTDLVDEFGRIRWDEGLNVRFSGVGYSLEEGKIPPTMLTEEFFCLHDYTITLMED